MYSKRNDIHATFIHFSDCEGKEESAEPKLFETLGENDILFVDLGHTVQTGGDVNRVILDVLVKSLPVVTVHFMI